MLDTTPDQLEVLNLLLDDAELLPQCDDRTVERVVLHMLPDLIEGEADLLHDADRIEIIELTRTVVSIAILRIHIGRRKQADPVVENQCLPGNMLLLRQLADGKQILRHIALL